MLIVLYRWHACVGEKDTKWIEELMRKYSQTPWDQVSNFSLSLFEERFEKLTSCFVFRVSFFIQMTQEDFVKIYRGLAGEMGPDVKKWTFGGLKRTGKDGTGKFS